MASKSTTLQRKDVYSPTIDDYVGMSSEYVTVVPCVIIEADCSFNDQLPNDARSMSNYCNTATHLSYVDGLRVTDYDREAARHSHALGGEMSNSINEAVKRGGRNGAPEVDAETEFDREAARFSQAVGGKMSDSINKAIRHGGAVDKPFEAPMAFPISETNQYVMSEPKEIISNEERPSKFIMPEYKGMYEDKSGKGYEFAEYKSNYGDV